jgi:hypothetical protein
MINKISNQGGHRAVLNLRIRVQKMNEVWGTLAAEQHEDCLVIGPTETTVETKR